MHWAVSTVMRVWCFFLFFFFPLSLQQHYTYTCVFFSVFYCLYNNSEPWVQMCMFSLSVQQHWAVSTVCVVSLLLQQHWAVSTVCVVSPLLQQHWGCEYSMRCLSTPTATLSCECSMTLCCFSVWQHWAVSTVCVVSLPLQQQWSWLYR